ncbi:hypothetical protein Agabi119p4_2714 [Agaricus bisporus var. burnettii]|uniref:Uncharacterized protein n=1 Tax=Agaricus bisporus var. burnettii TaxID=192524 RepID=A0A8H7F9N9_AGABI|nr:hypothetical protein Agabi119p4_2714 [Agaricus bisporus var. burnettii]
MRSRNSWITWACPGNSRRRKDVPLHTIFCTSTPPYVPTVTKKTPTQDPLCSVPSPYYYVGRALELQNLKHHGLFII